MTGLPVGLVTPVLTAVPGQHAEWERTASVDDLVRVVQCADRLGLDHVTCSEHVAVPTAVARERGGTYWDPLATLSYLACATDRIRLATHVVVLGYAHPLALAKRYATLDRLSGGRLVLGVGVGSLAEEFALLGAPFDDRGARADDALRALRAGFASTTPSYEGQYYSFTDLVVDPAPVQPRVPIWVGGRSRRSLRRAVELGDGWAPFGLGYREIAQLLADVDLPDGFDVVLPTGRVDPLGDPDGTRSRVERARAAGATRLSASVASSSPQQCCEALEALVELAGPPPELPA